MPDRDSLPIIFTDLDGTLLDRDAYDCHAALPALDLIRRRGVPLVFCSSKTRAEQTELRDRLGVRHPFIIEDGSALCFDAGYFPFEVAAERREGDVFVLPLGPAYDSIRAAIRAVREETGIELKGFADVTDERVAALTGLDLEAAGRARAREFEETLVTPMTQETAARVAEALARRDLALSRGARFYAVKGRSDKGTAVKVLDKLYRRWHGATRTVGLGDSFNDQPMLRAVDVPVLVEKKAGGWENLDVPDLLRVEGAGPEGWNRFVLDFLGGD